MSNREIAIDLIGQIPDYKLSYVIAFLQGASIPDSDTEHIPNAETIEAIKECEEMIKNGTGQRFTGSTKDFFKMLMEED